MDNEKKLNTQMPGKEALLAPLQKLNLMDDFLFDVTTADLEACQIIIELSLGIKIRNIRWKEGQKVIHNLPGKRGIRMDFCAEDESGRIFDIEMQKRNAGNLPKRTRYYQALLDAPLLESGEKSFDHLNPTYIVIICGFDLYGLGKYRYSFENTCRESKDLVMGDECQKIFLNTRGHNDSEVEKTVIDFLHYVERSTEDSLPVTCDKRLRHLHEKIRNIKSNEQMGVTYMKMEERDRLIQEAGKNEGLSEGQLQGAELKLIELICRKLRKGKSAALIADELDEDFKIIQTICDAASECAPEYNSTQVYEQLKKNIEIE